MKVLLLVYYPDSLTFTLARAISRGGHEVVVNSVTEADNQWDVRMKQRLLGLPNVAFTRKLRNDPKDTYGRAVCQLHPRLMQNKKATLPDIGNVGKISAFTMGDRRSTHKYALRKQWLEIRRFPGIFLHAEKILYKDGFYSWDLYSLINKRGVVGFDPHSLFLIDDELHACLFDTSWEPESPRSISVNFAGSQDPTRRLKILDGIRHLFSAGVAGASSEEDARETKNSMYWHEYTDAEGGSLPPRLFIDVLTQSDFTLAPPGHYLLTHRPIEALLRGSIPILNKSELPIYDMQLQDGINCIAVEENDWRSAVVRAMSMDEAAIVTMRRNIKAMESEHLSDEAISRRIRERIGVC